MVASLIPLGATGGVKPSEPDLWIFETQAIAPLEAMICESANGCVYRFGGQKAVEPFGENGAVVLDKLAVDTPDAELRHAGWAWRRRSRVSWSIHHCIAQGGHRPETDAP
jgi:hypothetical protein